MSAIRQQRVTFSRHNTRKWTFRPMIRTALFGFTCAPIVFDSKVLNVQSGKVGHNAVHRSHLYSEAQCRSTIDDEQRQHQAGTGLSDRAKNARRIYVLGLGNIGKLVAHAIRELPEAPPVTLLFHRRSLFEAWEKSAKKISVKCQDTITFQGGFDAELVECETFKWNHRYREETVLDAISPQFDSRAEYCSSTSDHTYTQMPIRHLLVATKTVDTISALTNIHRRLSPGSTLCFLQNGMGLTEELDFELFASFNSRPKYVQCVVSHGAKVSPEEKQQDPFCVNLARRGTIFLGVLPTKARCPVATRLDSAMQTETFASFQRIGDNSAGKVSKAECYLSSILENCSTLSAVRVPPLELLQLQMEKLAINAIINPLTALLDATCGSLLDNSSTQAVIRLMLGEIAHVLHSLPELRCLPHNEERFSDTRLQSLVNGICKTSRDHVSSMLADVRTGRQTEIEHLNGYILKRADEIGVKCPVNAAIMEAVLRRCKLNNAAQSHACEA